MRQAQIALATIVLGVLWGLEIIYGPPITAAWIQAVATSVAALAAAITFGAVAFQALYTRRAAEETHDAVVATRRALEVSLRQAEAAERSARTAEQHTVLSMRARVFVKMVTLEGVADGDKIRIRLDLLNAGPKPAQIHRWGLQAVLGTTLPSPDWMTNWTGTTHESNAPLSPAPDQLNLVSGAGPLPSHEFAAWVAGTLRMYVFGFVDYDAGFGNNRRLHYCREFALIPNMTFPAVVPGLLSTAKGYNTPDMRMPKW